MSDIQEQIKGRRWRGVPDLPGSSAVAQIVVVAEHSSCKLHKCSNKSIEFEE